MTQRLTDKESQWLARNRRVQPKLLVVGLILLLLGSSYSLWASYRLVNQWGSRPSPAFDGPIARLETLFVHKPEISAPPQTASEVQAKQALNRVSAYFGCLLAFVLRFILGSCFLMAGLIFTTSAMQARQFLAVIDKLNPPSDRPTMDSS